MSELTKFCKYCGKSIPAAAKFCRFCGKQLAVNSSPTESVVEKPTEPISVEQSHEEEPIISTMGKPVEPVIQPEPVVKEPVQVQQPQIEEPVISSAVQPHIEEPIIPPMEKKPVEPILPPEEPNRVDTSSILAAIHKQDATSKLPTGQVPYDTNTNIQTIADSNIPKTSTPVAKPKRPAKKKKKSSAGKVVLIIIGIIALLLGLAVGGSYLFRSQLAPMYPDGGFGLPFDYSLEIPWLQDAKDELNEGTPEVITDPTDVPSQTAVTGNGTTTVAGDDVIAQALEKEFGSQPTAADYASVTTVTINGDQVSFNKGSASAVVSPTGSINLESLSPCTNLTNITVKNVASLTMPTSTNTTVNIISIDNCTLASASAEGIQNYLAVTNLSIQNSNLSDLSVISKMGTIHSLQVNNNQITSTDTIKANMPNLAYCSIYGNAIWDYRGLANVDLVDIWGKGSTTQDSIYTLQRDSLSRQIQVLVVDLRIRTSPSAADDSNALEDTAIADAYYYILDEYWDDQLQTTWYKVGNNMWIASNEGSWTKLYE